jgi:hypothetical protein
MSEEYVPSAADEEFAAELLGTHLLVGVTHVDHGGRVLDQQQFHGTVIRASVSGGVTLRDPQGGEHWVPLIRDAFQPAEPGEYRLRSTGEVVKNPTWLSTWTVHPPERH